MSDPVALSPLARGPGDARGVAHFQLDPDGRVRTPYAREAGEPIEDPALAARAARVAALVESPGFE
ncbi:MAG TPA: hypothetical protein RMG45_04210, partial [Polyangiaceae bacterium LLY-WYZ-15_(1-7)]|nr:hypothetical protein [Polyangiaceae bacterium LLY-WYZ-15_(1-7)]